MERVRLPIIIAGVLIFLLALRLTTLNTPPTLLKSQEKIALSGSPYSAWIPDWEELRSINSLNGDAGNKLAQILPVWYRLDSSGIIHESLTENSDLLLGISRSKGIKITPSVTNLGVSGFDPNRVSSMLQSNQEDAINFLLTTAKRRGYDGWDLDFENISKEDKDKYTFFVKNLADKMHERGLTLSVTVHSQEKENDTRVGVVGQDVENLGKYSDQMRVMAYDFHNTDTEAGPIIPVEDLVKTIKYVISKVEIKKIVIGLPTYGYDWEENGSTKPLQFMEIQTLLESNKISPVRDGADQELLAKYDNHQVWYLDSTSLIKLKSIINSYGINNICFWHLGGEDQTVWNKI